MGTEKANSPLGYGPLANTERAASEQADAQREKLKDYTGSRSETPADSARISSSVTERISRPLALERILPATSASVAQSSVPPPKPADWLGLFRGKDTTRYQVPNFPSQPMDDPNARIRVEASQGQQIKFILIDSSNDKDLCTLAATIDGIHAKVDPGQPCFGTEDDEGSLTVRVKSGLGLLQDSTLTLDLTLDANIQSEQFQADGSVEYHFEGKKNS